MVLKVVPKRLYGTTTLTLRNIQKQRRPCNSALSRRSHHNYR